MKALTLTAIFDGERIRLEDDVSLPANTRLLVTVLPPGAGSEQALRGSWTALAADSLARAYGTTEPEYTTAMLREPDPRDAGR
ncbi:MAG: hypothetical protein ACKOUK_00610 [Verrucomicrobiota bacterium]|jgi:hypothetical protein